MRRERRFSSHPNAGRRRDGQTPVMFLFAAASVLFSATARSSAAAAAAAAAAAPPPYYSRPTNAPIPTPTPVPVTQTNVAPERDRDSFARSVMDEYSSRRSRVFEPKQQQQQQQQRDVRIGRGGASAEDEEYYRDVLGRTGRDQAYEPYEDEYGNLVDSDDLALLDSIFEAAAPTSSADARADVDDDARPLTIDDEEIDGLFERAGKLLDDDGDYGQSDGQDFGRDEDYSHDANVIEEKDDARQDGHADMMYDYLPVQNEPRHEDDYDDFNALVESDAADDASVDEQLQYDAYPFMDGVDGGGDGGGGEDLQQSDYDPYPPIQQLHDLHEEVGVGKYDEYEYESYSDPTLAMEEDILRDDEFDDIGVAESLGNEEVPDQDYFHEDEDLAERHAALFSGEVEDEGENGIIVGATGAFQEDHLEEQHEDKVVDNGASDAQKDKDQSLIDEATVQHPTVGYGIDEIIQAHRNAVADDLGLEPTANGPPPQLASIQQRQLHNANDGNPNTTTNGRYSERRDDPRSYGYGHGFNSGGGGGGGGGSGYSAIREERAEAKKQKKEQNFRRSVSSDVHRTYTKAVAAVIRGDASPHVPADLFGQTLEEERAGTKLAGLGPEFDDSGMYSYGAFCTEEALHTYSDWSALLQSTSGNQCGAVDVKTAKAKLYGGAQYHRCVRCFSALLLTLPLPEITEEELSLLLTASGSAGGGSHGAAGHDGPDLLRTAAILCRTKMEGLVRFALDELAGRVEYILRDRAWEVVSYSALVRPASEDGANAYNGYKIGSKKGVKAAADFENVPYQYASIEETFKKVVRESWIKFVKKSVAEAAEMGWTDAMALLRYVSWDLTTQTPRRRTRQRYSSGHSAATKAIRGGTRGQSSDTPLGEVWEDLPANTISELDSSSQAPQARNRRTAAVRPVKKSKRQRAKDKARKKAEESVAKAMETQGNDGFFSKVRLFRRTKKHQVERGDGSSQADVSAYYDLNDLYGLDDEHDRHSGEDLGDLVGGVLSRGSADDRIADQKRASSSILSAPTSIHIGQVSADVDDEDSFELSKTQAMEDDEMLSVLLRAAAAAASATQLGTLAFETQTRAAMTALVKFVTDKWRRDLVSLIVGKFNSFCLLGFHSEFGTFLRKEFEVKLLELEEDSKTKSPGQ